MLFAKQNDLILMTDKQLIERVANGEQVAFSCLVQRYLSALIKFSVRYTLSIPCSEDIVQESFLRVWSNAGSWCSSKGSVKSWLFKIVYHATVDDLRKNKQRPLPESHFIENGDVDSNPENKLLKQQQTQCFKESLSQLPERQRTALTLFISSGLSVAEVSCVLDLSTQATTSLLARARRALRDNMQAGRTTGVTL